MTPTDTRDEREAGEGRERLRMILDFAPDSTDLDKAVCAFDASLAFRELIDAVTEDVGATDAVTWRHGPVIFDGPDADAQPIYDALVAAYQKGRDSVSAAPPPAQSGREGT